MADQSNELALFHGGMIAEGHMVEERILVAAVRKLPERFKSYSDLHVLLIREGAPDDASHRAADRALQKLRKAGIASFSKGWWTLDRAALSHDEVKA